MKQAKARVFLNFGVCSDNDKLHAQLTEIIIGLRQELKSRDTNLGLL
jgi:hypothetical protein